MKRTALVAILMVALVFGVVVYANAQTENVTVTATINPAFLMTLSGNSFTHGILDVPSTSDIQGPVVTVRSNETYDYSLEAVTVAGPDTLSETAILALQDQTESVTQGTKGARGVSRMDYRYDLDLSGDAAYDVESGNYNFTYGYTAVQD